MQDKQGDDLVGKFVEQMSKLLDEKLENVPTKNDLENVIANLKQRNIETEEKFSVMEKRCSALERQVEILTKKATEKNVIMHLPKGQGIEKAKEICDEMLQSKDSVTSGHLIRTKNTKSEAFVLELTKKEDVNKIMQSSLKVKEKLKANGVSMHRDYPLAARLRRKRIIECKTQLSAEYNSLNMKVQGDKLIVENKTFYIDENNELKCGDVAAAVELQKLLQEKTQITHNQQQRNNQQSERATGHRNQATSSSSTEQQQYSF